MYMIFALCLTISYYNIRKDVYLCVYHEEHSHMCDRGERIMSA